MCNPHLLAVFMMLCNSYLSSHPSFVPILSKDKCVKAYDICVDRKIKNLEGTKEESAEDAAISECEFYLNTQHTFGEFYTDISCQ